MILPGDESDAPERITALPEPAPDATAAASGDGSASGYVIHLDRFDGPLDLLLYLIQRDEIDIYDIPIARITKQYLELLDVIDVFNLDNAADFLVMAATLMRIKVRLLLPIQRPGEEDEEGDPRDELVRRLLEYKKYKEAAEKLAVAEEQRRDWYGRGAAYPFLEEEQEPAELTLSMFDLLTAVRAVFEQLKGDHRHHVFQEIYTVEEQTTRILGVLRERESVRFDELFAGLRVKMAVVVTFVAMLELMKQGRLRARQVSPYGEIWIYRALGEPAALVEPVVEGEASPPSPAPATPRALAEQAAGVASAQPRAPLAQEDAHAQ